MNLVELGSVRALMLEEFELDVQGGSLYYSERFTPTGRAQYPELMRQAIQAHDEQWLENIIRQRGLLKQFESRNTQRGIIQAKVPVTAAQTAAEGKFNRFYIRGVCRVAIDRGDDEVVVYRAKHVERPRPGSQHRIGQHMSAQAILDDLRKSSSVEPALGVPAGANSGLSVHFI
jgi:hypothetical protein